MGSVRRALPGLAHVTPLRQGQLSNLCGLYATLNALQLLAWPRNLDRPALQSLYAHGVWRLARQRRLRSTLVDGMHTDQWRALVLELVELARPVLGCRIRYHPTRRATLTTSASLAGSADLALEKGRPLLCRVVGALDHYTVIAGSTETRWLLFDSQQLRWLEKRSTAWGKASGKRHSIESRSIIQLERVGDPRGVSP